MAKPSKVHRPTEDAAVGATESRPRPAAGLKELWALLVAAVRRHDRLGAQLLRAKLVRAMAGSSPVGAAS